MLAEEANQNQGALSQSQSHPALPFLAPVSLDEMSAQAKCWQKKPIKTKVLWLNPSLTQLFLFWFRLPWMKCLLKQNVGTLFLQVNTTEEAKSHWSHWSFFLIRSMPWIASVLLPILHELSQEKRPSNTEEVATSVGGALAGYL